MYETIYERLLIMIYQCGVFCKQNIKPTDRFVEDLNMDSLDNLILLLDVENEFDIEIPDDQAEKLITVEDLARYITNATPTVKRQSRQFELPQLID